MPQIACGTSIFWTFLWRPLKRSLEKKLPPVISFCSSRLPNNAPRTRRITTLSSWPVVGSLGLETPVFPSDARFIRGRYYSGSLSRNSDLFVGCLLCNSPENDLRSLAPYCRASCGGRYFGHKENPERRNTHVKSDVKSNSGVGPFLRSRALDWAIVLANLFASSENLTLGFQEIKPFVGYRSPAAIL